MIVNRDLPASQQKTKFLINDTEWFESTITKVDEYNDSYSIGFNGYSCSLPKVDRDGGPVNIKVGDTITVYGTFWGRMRGVFINDQCLWYRDLLQDAIERTDEARAFEKEADKKALVAKPEIDELYDKLPDVFKTRIDKFRNHKPYGGAYHNLDVYEVNCCAEATVIAELFKTSQEVSRVAQLPYEDKKLMYPAASEHSGNSLGVVFTLAYLYLRDKEEGTDFLSKMHGGLAPLLGCAIYSCH